MRMISIENKNMLLSLNPEDLTLDKFKEFFAIRVKQQPLFSPTDIMILEKDEFYNKEQVQTTVGRFVINKLLLSPNIIKVIGYQNIVLNDKGISKLDGTIFNLRLAEKISVKDVHQYLDKCTWMYSLNKYLVESLSVDINIMPDKVKKEKDKLQKEYADQLAAGNINVANMMEKKLIDLSMEEIKTTNGYEIYESGARGSVGNNYKNTVLMRGGIMNFNDPSKFDVSTASLVEGIPKEEYHIYANIMVAGSYSRAKNTEIGGYLGKKLHSAFQHIMIDKIGTDCGTDKTIEIEITDFNEGMLYYRFIVEGSQLVLLTPDNIKSYIGKKVKMRSPLYCCSDKFCHKCAGELYHRIGITNVGLLTNRQGTTLMQYAMKQFHDNTVKLAKLDVKKYIKEI